MNDEIDYSIHYKRWHKGTDEEYVAQSKLYGRLLNKVINNIPKDGKVLDYGCGSGLLVYFLTKQFLNVEGVDASSHQIETGLAHGLPVKHLPVLEYPKWAEDHKNYYDAIFLFDVLEHVPVVEQIAFLRKLVGTLKQSAPIFIKVPNANSLMAARWRYIDWTHLSSFTECSLDFVCLNSGLKNVAYLDDETSLSPRYPWLPRWGLRNFYLRRLGRAIWRIYLGAEIGQEVNNVKLGINLFAKATKA